MILVVRNDFFMKRIALLLFIFTLFAGSLSAQTHENEDKKSPIAIKAYPFRGMYLDKNTHYEKFGPINPAGVHMGVEFPSFCRSLTGGNLPSHP